jgi:hypothetical protein
MYQTSSLHPWDWFQSIHSDQQMQIIGGAMFCVVMLTTILCILINSIHRRRTEANLKRELLDRGMTAEEIAMVASATPTKCRSKTAVASSTGGNKI